MRVGTFQTDTSRDPPLHRHRTLLFSHILVHHTLTDARGDRHTPHLSNPVKHPPLPTPYTDAPLLLREAFTRADSICDHRISNYRRGLCW
jgi:hypothetical protein